MLFRDSKKNVAHSSPCIILFLPCNFTEVSARFAAVDKDVGLVVTVAVAADVDAESISCNTPLDLFRNSVAMARILSKVISRHD